MVTDVYCKAEIVLPSCETGEAILETKERSWLSDIFSSL